MTAIKDGYHGDTNMMYIVGGETSILADRLCQVAQEAMYRVVLLRTNTAPILAILV